MIRILLCDDQDMVREGLTAILSRAPDMQVVGAARDGAEAIDLAERHRPDLVLMDLKMPVMDGVTATRKLRERFPTVKVLVLTTYDEDSWVLDAVRSGAAGYLLKATPRERLFEAIRDTMAGRTPLDASVAGHLLARVAGSVSEPEPRALAELSGREREVLTLVGQGLDNHEIARRLHLSEGTVRNYVSSILAKLDVTDRTKAAVLAIRYGLVRMDGAGPT